MGGFSIWHWLVLGVIVLLLFGKGRFSDMMGDVAKGIKSFKHGMGDEVDERAKQDDRPPQRIEAQRPADLTQPPPEVAPAPPPVAPSSSVTPPPYRPNNEDGSQG